MGRQLARARPGCLRWLRAFTHDEHLVEDIMSVAVVWCWEHRDTFTPVIAHEDGMHGVRAWLWGVARHRALAARSSMRSRARTMLSIDEPRTSKDGKQADWADRSLHFAAKPPTLELTDEDRKIEEALALLTTLAPEIQEALRLRFWESLSVPQIAGRLGNR